MADFVAILKKTIEGQGAAGADMRARVYARARQTISQKLEVLTPAPTEEQKARQLRALDEAIIAVEASYSRPVEAEPLPPEPVDPLDAFISEAEAETKKPPFRMPEPAPAPVTPVFKPAPAAAAETKPFVRPAALPKFDGPETLVSSRVTLEKRSGGGTLLWLSLGVLLAAGASYAAYVKRDAITAYYKSLTAPSAPEVKKVVTTSVKAPDPAKPAPKVEPAAAPAEPGAEKFTQRLTEEGKEVEAGPAAASGSGEGESVAQVTKPAAAVPATPEANAPETPAVPAAEPAIKVGQKAVFYEEKTGSEEGTVDQGAVVWSAVQDSPGADQPAEPAIRAEVDVPGKGVKLKLTIKRNADKTLPASHIVEMAFSVPDGFEGGSVEGVQRVTFKDTEQAPGNPLVGVPANFGDGFFLIALTDEKSAVEANTALMNRQSWIDIPLTYKTGRRALISIEKGVSGDKVFQEVFKAWAAKASG